MSEKLFIADENEIRSGSLEAGERLPSTRALASGLRVARSTADLAYSQLLSEAASPCCFACWQLA